MFCTICGQPIATPGAPCTNCGAATVPSPAAPAWGSPVPPGWNIPDPNQPGFTAPPAYYQGAPNSNQPGFAAQPAYYNAPMPARPRSKGVVGLVIGAFALLVIAAAVIGYSEANQNDGVVLFSHAAISGCSVDKAIVSAQVNSPVYFSANLRDSFAAAEPISLSVSFNGVADTIALLPQDSAYDCLYEAIPVDFMNTPGILILTFTNADGKVEASGTLTITAAP